MFGLKAVRKQEQEVSDIRDFREYIYKECYTYRHTPDLWLLDQYEKMFIFVYDRTMKRHPEENRINGGEYHGEAFTDTKDWAMWKKKLGKETFPVAMRIKHHVCGASPAHIRGQLYLVPIDTICKLDIERRNHVEFRRERVLVQRPYKKIFKQRDVWAYAGTHDLDHAQGHVTVQGQDAVWAWMYVGKPKYWDDQIDTGYHFSPVERYAPKNIYLDRQFYLFTYKEYRD